MASGVTPTVLQTSAEITNGVKLMRLIVDGGTEALRQTFSKCRPGDLQIVLSTSQPTLQKLRKNKVITKNQWDKLYPTPPNKPNINDFDISLMYILLRNICGLSKPSLPVWENKPCVSDHTVVADIVRIKLFRNERFGHIPNTAVSSANFKTYWGELSSALVRLGIDQKEIDQLFKSENVLNKQLAYFDFQQEVKMYYEKYTKGSREWVFEQVSTWFHDESSDNQAFVISALAGMGKSVIAAVICKRLAEHVGAYHFFQYNNSRYNNPNFLLQSLAWQICKVIPAYEKALIEKLSGNLGQSMNDMDLEGLFSLLFKEPFSYIAGDGKRILIVLDAVDESEHEGRQELANLISNHFHKLPSCFRFVITTRPEKNLIEKFGKLKYLFIETNDERNLDDIKLVLQKRISCPCGPTPYIDNLAKKSNGLMLYAFFLSEICKEEPSIVRDESFPQGLGEFYEKYFQRLKHELKDSLEISEDTFLSFLSTLAVAMEPLPQAFIGSIFGFKKSSPSTKKNVKKALNILSSLLVLKENKSISFFHKSIRDWLVDNSEHYYTVDEQYGHDTIFDLCVEELNELNKTGIKDVTDASVALQYALKYFIPHMLNGTENKGNIETFSNSFLADLEVMFVSVCVDVDLTLYNLSNLSNHKLCEHVSESTRTTMSELFFVARRFAFLLREYPQSFLQHVVNVSKKEVSDKASHLLNTRYKDIAYLELVEKKRKNDAVELSCLVSGTISGIGVSPEHDYVVCSYKESGIELFSLATGRSEWILEDFTVERPVPCPVMLPHCIVFHPHKSLILPGRLDLVLTLKGTLVKTELFQCVDNDSKFTNSCFSKDGNRLVTNYCLDLVVWNTSNGQKEKHLKCFSLLSSFSFTASGKFFGTTSIDNVFTVYDAMNRFCKVNSVTMLGHFPFEIVSTFEINCWFFLLDGRIVIVNDDLSFSRSCNIDVHRIVLPGNLFTCELKHVLEPKEHDWFLKVRQYLNHTFGWSSYSALRYIEVGDKSLLVFSQDLSAMHVFSIKYLKDAELQETNMKGVFSNISCHGNFVYLNSTWKNMIIVHNVDSGEKYSIPCPKPNQLYLPVVRNGVILCGENRTPTLWNCGLTKCEERFVELAYTERCMSVSEKVIACICKNGVIFFDVVCREIVYRMSFAADFTLDPKSVKACSIKYHVLIENDLWKDGIKVDGWTDIISKYVVLRCFCSFEFSPEGNRLALTSAEINKVFIFDVMSIKCLSHVAIFGPENDILRIKFFDNENLLCSSTNHVLYLINVERGEILNCLDFGDIPALLSVSHKRSIVCAGRNCSEDFELINVWLPRTS